MWGPVGECPADMAGNMASAKARRRRPGRQRRKGKGAPSSVPDNVLSVEQLLSSAAEQLDTGNTDSAIDIYRKATSLHPNNLVASDVLAEALLDTGQPEAAEEELRRGIALRDDKFERHMYLGQLMGNTEDAVHQFRAGLQLLQKERASASEERCRELDTYEASAHCAIAEILLAVIEDTNDHTVAERLDKEVQKAVMSALATAEDGSAQETEAILALANLRLSQGRKEDAKAAMVNIARALGEGLALLDDGDGEEQSVKKALEILPPLEMRIAIGKQFIETELWTEAIAILASVMCECDFNVEVWYLLAVSYWKMGDFEEARSTLQGLASVMNSPEGFDGTLTEDMVPKLLAEIEKSASGDHEDQDVDMVTATNT